jgi:flagellar hook-basal body complex protein FliE
MSVDSIGTYNMFGKIAKRSKSIPKEEFGIDKISKPSEKKGFGDILNDAVASVDSMRKNADSMVEGMLTGSKSVPVHDAMIALEKADVAFELLNQVRKKIIRAYEEVMRTPV